MNSVQWENSVYRDVVRSGGEPTGLSGNDIDDTAIIGRGKIMKASDDEICSSERLK